MKVKELIEQLKTYGEDTELFVEYWDKETVEQYGTSRKMTEDEWVYAVQTMENGEFAFQSHAAEQLVDAAEDAMKEEEG